MRKLFSLKFRYEIKEISLGYFVTTAADETFFVLSLDKPGNADGGRINIRYDTLYIIVCSIIPVFPCTQITSIPLLDKRFDSPDLINTAAGVVNCDDHSECLVKASDTNNCNYPSY